MPRARAGVATAASITATLLLAACAEIDEEPLRFPAPPPEARAPPPPRLEPSTPGQVKTAIYRWFLAAGYPAFQAAALVDHARIESGLNPCIAGRGVPLHISMGRFCGSSGCMILPAPEAVPR